MGRYTVPLIPRFLKFVSKDPATGCWLWTGNISTNGYGNLLVTESRNKRKTKTAHRLAWTLFRGPIPSGLQVLHKCDVKRCVNPDHLWLGTAHENSLDMGRKCRGRKGAKGLPRGVYVRKETGKFCAFIDVKGKRHYGGAHATVEEAVAAEASLRAAVLYGYSRPDFLGF